MSLLHALYRPSLALLTDLYELTMAAAAFDSGAARLETAFHLTFRDPPFGSGFTVAAGLAQAIEYVQGARFEADDLAYLATLGGDDGEPLFRPEFLAFLAELRMEVDVEAVLEGTVVFPHEPLLRVTGPAIPCMLLEAPLLTLVNFQTLVATKAARIRLAAGDDPVLEFGLRRAQGVDGAISAARAAYLGGCDATSNVLAGRLLGIPVRGTHAHSWVLLHGDEREAFTAYARAMPGNCVFLVDTYDTLQGVRHAIEVGRTLRAHGKRLLGVRIDSGDLAWLSVEARRLLDEAGFPEARVYASNELDEHVIQSLKTQGAAIGVWGVGTRLVTAHDDPALGGIYKLTAVRRPGHPWEPRVKVSEQAVKTSVPGILQVRRFRAHGPAGGAMADMIYDVALGPEGATIVDPVDPLRRRTIAPGTPFEDLLVPVVRGGRPVTAPEALDGIRARVRRSLDAFHPAIKRFLNPHAYPVGLERRLHEQRAALVLAARGHG